MSPTAIAFPEKAVVATLEGFWDKQMGATSVSPLFPLGPQMDSLTAVLVLISVESVLRVGELPQSLIKGGGYSSKDEFVQHLLQRLKKHVAKLAG